MKSTQEFSLTAKTKLGKYVSIPIMFAESVNSDLFESISTDLCEVDFYGTKRLIGGVAFTLKEPISFDVEHQQWCILKMGMMYEGNRSIPYFQQECVKVVSDSLGNPRKQIFGINTAPPSKYIQEMYRLLLLQDQRRDNGVPNGYHIADELKSIVSEQVLKEG